MRLTGRPKPGERLILSFTGTSPTPFIKKALKKGRCCGIIIFSNNVENSKQLRSLIEEIFRLSSIGPPLVCVDQEGGRVQRIKNDRFKLPAAREIGETMSPEETRKMAESLGEALASLGVNVNFAPVLDVLTEPRNSVIGDRSFGSTPEMVISHGISFARGLLSSGVLAVGKHFPGHGMTVDDSHQTLPTCRENKESLEKNHITPFKAAIQNGIPGLMTAHVVYKCLDPLMPATFSKIILHDLLREKLLFRGATFSDDLNMKAVSDNFSPVEIAELSLGESPDFLIHTGSQDEQAELIEELERAYEEKAKSEILIPIHERVRKFLSLVSY